MRSLNIVFTGLIFFRLTAALQILSALLMLLAASPLLAATQDESKVTLHSTTDLVAVMTLLPQTSLKKMPALIAQMEALALATEDVAVQQSILSVLQAQLSGYLYFRKDTQQLLVMRPVGSGYELLDPLTQKSVAFEKKNRLQKIRVNNPLRKHLQASLARLNLLSPDEKQRLKAVEQLMASPSAQNTDLLIRLRQQEKLTSVQHKIDVALALAALDAEDEKTRLAAVTTLSGSLEPLVKAKLEEKLVQDETGNFAEPNKKVRDAIQIRLADISLKYKLFSLLETLFFGLSLGSVLLLAAIGLSITFGVMGVINMAHGEMIMLGAYTTYVLQTLMPDALGWALVLSIPAAFVVAGLVGIAIERGVIRFLKGRPLETLLATFGLSLVLQQAVRTIFSPLNRQVVSPEWMSGALEINPILSITYNRLYVIVFSFLVFLLLLFVMKKTVLGLYVTAVSQNREMAKAMGIRTEWVDAMTFGLGSGIAGMAGVALSQLTNVGPNLGQAYIIDSFMVVVFGGVGNLWGTLVGGLGLGVLNKFLEPVTGAVLAKILVLVGIILFIQKRPRGLFPHKGRVIE